ncbi:hypothetical protein Dret_1537 [Desulfohalobium retbaense DSM 5692]|uniref:HTH IS21-type domain-containing protein n=1 Tax=Desulfohalobium retbaense (strain ATCC 49708 / DSM 5692 / JCM 16813 / HR100) TaxID=485915 RepID=C8X326_DESRD|nr:hypothetical protein Dret_1537 [Desulfohalobium retbaense DSM 5692]
MLNVEQFEFIRTSHRVYGLSISEIARKTGRSRTTIRKVLRNEHSGYAIRKQHPMPALEGFAEAIHSWLEQDTQRPVKQRHSVRWIFRRLANHSLCALYGSVVNVHQTNHLGPQIAFIGPLKDHSQRNYYIILNCWRGPTPHTSNSSIYQTFLPP